MLIDTLKFRNKLLEGGFEQAQADALVEALSAASIDYRATKADIEELRGEMKSMKWINRPSRRDQSWHPRQAALHVDG